MLLSQFLIKDKDQNRDERYQKGGNGDCPFHFSQDGINEGCNNNNNNKKNNSGFLYSAHVSQI